MLQRYTIRDKTPNIDPLAGRFGPRDRPSSIEVIEDSGGAWCDSREVSALEAENARLREIISDRDKRDAGFLRCESCGDWFSELSRGHDCDLCDKCADELLDDARKE